MKLAFVCVVFLSFGLLAQEPAASCACDAKARTLVIRYTPGLSDAEPPWPAGPRPVLFMSLLDINETESTVEVVRSETISCRLKSDRFEILLEPGVPNFRLLGRCGAAVTGVVTVKRNGEVVVDEQWFEEFDCHKRERMLERIIFRDGVAKPELVYVAYDE